MHALWASVCFLRPQSPVCSAHTIYQHAGLIVVDFWALQSLFVVLVVSSCPKPYPLPMHICLCMHALHDDGSQIKNLIYTLEYAAVMD